MSSAAPPAAANRPTQSGRSRADLRPSWESISRGVSLFWGLFLLFQVFLWGETYTVWWLGELPFSSAAQRGISALYALLLLVYGFSERIPTPLRMLTWIMTGILLGFSLLQVWNWYAAKEAGAFNSPVRVPFVLHVTGILSLIFAGLSQPGNDARSRQGGLLLTIVAFDLCLVTIPIAHIYCLGQISDAVPSRTILFAVEDDHNANSHNAIELSRYFSEEAPTQLVLIGSEEETSAWKTVLQPYLHDHQLQITTTTNLESTGKSLQSQLKDWKQDQPTSAVLIAGRPTQISPLRLHVLRAGLEPKQLVMGDGSLSVRSAAQEIPTLWLSYLPFRE
ncbi:MAG: hypothetical protein HUJ26_14170 [Planctomycetaceae bacterium]|nr:hypothetical protein [Planctomycetaceae bacterium]